MKKRIVLLMLAVFILSGFGCAGNYKLMPTSDRASAEDLLYTADLLYRLRDYSDAMDYYEKIITIYPDSVYANVAEKKFKKAEKRYRRHIVEGEVFEIFMGRRLKKYKLLEDNEKANAEGWLEKANLLYRMRDYGDAVDYYGKIIENYPDSVYAYVAEKKLKKAKKYYFKTIKKY